MTKLTFDRAAYAIELSAFRSATVASDGKADKVGATAMAALLLNELSPLALCITFYDAFAPTNAAGKAVEPKEADNGTIAVRNLEQPHVRGSGGARKLLEGLLYCHAQRDVSPATAIAVERFAMGEKFTHNGKETRNITMLVALIKAEKMRLARDKAGDTAKPDAETDATAEAATMTDGERLAAALALLQAVTVAPTDASERLVMQSLASEIDRIAALEVPAEQLQEAA
jgi:hypothetical protein